jgi:hypothetical protein
MRLALSYLLALPSSCALAGASNARFVSHGSTQVKASSFENLPPALRAEAAALAVHEASVQAAGPAARGEARHQAGPAGDGKGGGLPWVCRPRRGGGAGLGRRPQPASEACD